MDKLNGRFTMNTRMKMIALCVSAALAQMTANLAYADSGVGVDTTVGNALNPRSVSTIGDRDPDGMGQTEYQRSPTGFLNLEPSQSRESSKTESGWLYKGWAEAGLIGTDGDKNNAKFKEYKDLDTSLYLNNFGIEMEKPDTARYFELIGGGVAQDDQYYRLSFGRYNDWKVKAFYTETPHVFTSTYRNLWNGTGTGNQTLKTLTPGGTTNAATTDANIQAAALATPYSELGIVRTKGGARLDMNLDDQWKLFASYSKENKQGARPFGMVGAGAGGTGGVEIPESIDNDTHDFLAGLQWNDKLSSLNLQLQASFFRNNIDTMTVQNPMFLAAANGFAAGEVNTARYDMHPNNDYYNVKGEYARSFPDFYKSRFTAVVSAGSMRQNDNLIPYSSQVPAAVGGWTDFNGVDPQWDTTSSLSKTSSGARIDTRLLDFGLSLVPMNDLDVKGKMRHYETQNKTEYWACNPLTGQWGRAINDASGAALVTTNYNTGCNVSAAQALNLVPNNGNTNLRNIPYEYKQTNYTLAADYRLNRNNSFNASWEREDYDREHRERKETWEDKFKFGYVNRSIEEGTIRLSFENARRRGSTYISDPYEEFLSASLGPLPTAGGTTINTWIHVLANLRKFDLSDRDQNIVNARVNYALAPNLDGMVSLQLKDLEYPSSEYGRNGRQKQSSLNFDLSWRQSEKMNLYGFYSYQDGYLQQSNIQPGTACAIPAGPAYTQAQTLALLEACAQAGSTQFPLNRKWSEKQKDKNDVLGFGLNYDFGKAKLDMSYTYVNGSSKIDYSYDPAGLAMTAAATALAGSGFPALKFKQNIIEANLLVPYDKNTTIRLLYRYEDGRFADWHYDGVAAYPSPAANQQTYLDAGPQNYRVNILGALVKFSF